MLTIPKNSLNLIQYAIFNVFETQTTDRKSQQYKKEALIKSMCALYYMW